MAGSDGPEQHRAAHTKNELRNRVGDYQRRASWADEGDEEGDDRHLVWESSKSEKTSSSGSSTGKRRQMGPVQLPLELGNPLRHTISADDGSSEMTADTPSSSGTERPGRAVSSRATPDGYDGNLAQCDPESIADYPGYAAAIADLDLESVTAEQCKEMVAAGVLPSVGSLKHALGLCKPCAYLGSLGKQCSYMEDCRSCHFPHIRTYKRRPRKNRREQCKKAVANISEREADRIQEMATSNRSMSQGLAYMNRLIRQKKETAQLLCEGGRGGTGASSSTNHSGGPGSKMSL
eukprot:TRINITY_DN59478_c0_g1_i1.p1 TRINITY_DN59478_c0_g1~~TRINITY_DN59478_c0_g1_i1.p1  ORF type:complete len:292 (+),score=40.94 TRINITY_DN59478_c0_g1_i1:157-1032(+)